jgi:hypothetical protein
MRKIIYSAAVALLLMSGCIISDDYWTLYIYEDGKVAMIYLMDNIRSDNSGQDKLDEESQWLEDFRQNSRLEELKNIGATNVQAILLKETAPYSALFTATFDSVESLGRLFDLNTDKDESTLKLVRKGNMRTLIFHIVEDQENTQETSAKDTNEISTPFVVFKFVPQNGTITDASGFKISTDKRSCIIDIEKLEELERKSNVTDISVSWEIRGSED